MCDHRSCVCVCRGGSSKPRGAVLNPAGLMGCMCVWYGVVWCMCVCVGGVLCSILLGSPVALVGAGRWRSGAIIARCWFRVSASPGSACWLRPGLPGGVGRQPGKRRGPPPSVPREGRERWPTALSGWPGGPSFGACPCWRFSAEAVFCSAYGLFQCLGVRFLKHCLVF